MSKDLAGDQRFATQAKSAAEVLQEQTIGLVQLADFRKRRAEAFEQSGNDSKAVSGSEEHDDSSKAVSFKKKKKGVKKGGLSFGNDDHDENDSDKAPAITKNARSALSEQADSSTDDAVFKKRLKANTSVAFQPQSQSKAALAKEAQIKEAEKQKNLRIAEAVKATEFMLPFVFFDGKDHVGGKVRMEKGNHLWLFLERARKVGAENATGSNGSRKDWARISVDDLMLVRQDLILPPHYDFHYFVVNKSKGYHGLIFDLSAEPTAATPQHLLDLDQPKAEDDVSQPSGLSMPNSRVETAKKSDAPDNALEGFSDDAAFTRVVDRRWYEKNKHIFPASIWEHFDPERDYSVGGRKDRDGNQMFFSS